MLIRAILTIAVFLQALGCGHPPAPKAAQLPVPPATCSLFVGSASGNVESRPMRLAICPHEHGVSGWAHFEGKRSGWSMAEITGFARPDGTLVLKDTKLVGQEAALGWQVCLNEFYEVRMLDANTVEGEFRSGVCHDVARFALKKAQ